MKVRCIDASGTGELESGAVYDVHRETPDSYVFLWADGSTTSRFKGRFEPVTDEPDVALLNLAFPLPKVDRYAEHREKSWDEVTICAQMRHSDAVRGATARLHAGLESEKVRERVRAFPSAGRNPR